MHTAQQRVARLYHSVALLTPDGKVITAGSNPQRKTEELRIEVFWPPYLFHGPRPDLQLAATTTTYGATLDATVTGAPRDACLIHPTSCTHSSNNDQRLVDLPFTSPTPGTITLTMPSTPALAPPGWYLLFVVDTEGVPSSGRWIQLGP
nr:galactose oxidase early set domain-containing protein [Nocardia transvalensis]